MMMTRIVNINIACPAHPRQNKSEDLWSNGRLRMFCELFTSYGTVYTNSFLIRFVVANLDVLLSAVIIKE